MVIQRNGVSCSHIADPAEALEQIDDNTQAVVLVPPLRGMSATKVRQRVPTVVPVLVALAGNSNTARLRKLYTLGITAVFALPKERDALLRTILRLVDLDPSAFDQRRRTVDLALEEKAKAALRSDDSHDCSLEVFVVHGMATLVGRVDALWKIYAAEHVVEQVPRIQDVDTSGVVVVGAKRTDDAIANAVRQVVKHTSDVDESTIATAVHDGQVTLSGSAQNRRELKRLVELIRHIRGVRFVDRYVVVSKKAKQQDRSLAKLVNDLLKSRVAGRYASAAIFGGVCVLTGRAPNARERRLLGELAEAQPGVTRVVNKLTVASHTTRS